jgi:BMFP domain-containing protein YqiC
MPASFHSNMQRLVSGFSNVIASPKRRPRLVHRMRCDTLEISFSRACPRTAAMPDPKIFEEFCARLSALIAASPAADIEKNARALLSGFFARLDLVSREEFDIQAQVLQRTREKIDALEKRLERLEPASEPIGAE